MKYETNENGQVLMNLRATAAPYIKHYSRYNGGWIKEITGLDKSKTDGYSILGDFAPKGISWNTPGLYMDCSIDGSRKNQERHFSLFVLKRDGSIQALPRPMWKYAGPSGGDWAPRFWEAITEALADPHLTDPTPKSRLETLKAQEADLIAALEKVRAEIQAEEAGQ